MKNTYEIVFYGQDNTAINEAYISYFVNGKSSVCKVKDFIDVDSNHTAEGLDADNENSENIAEILLWTFLQDIDAEIDKYVVGHSEGKKDLDDEKDHIINLGREKSFGQLVGTIRKEYTQKGNRSKEEGSKKENYSETKVKEYIKKLFGFGKWPKSDVSIKLVIYSRFESLDPKKLEHTSPYFLASLLLNGKLKFESKLNVDFDYNDIFDFYMLFLFKKNFEEALLKGYFKKYQRFEKNDDRLRGAIDIARHIRLNMGMDNGKIAYSYRENTTDNMVNHLILTAFDYMKERYTDLVNRNFDIQLERALNNLRHEIGYPKYKTRTIVAQNNIPISHPFFSEYKDLQEICLKILRDEGVSPFENEDEHLDGVLYYVPDLWEEYLSNYIKEAIRKDRGEAEEDVYFSMEEQKKIKVMTDINGEGGHETEPDYVFSYVDREEGKDELEGYFFILDAKYRYGWPDALKGTLNSNNLEDYTKCLRDMDSIASIASAVAFPIKEEEYEEKYRMYDKLQFVHRLTIFNEYVSFYSLPIIIPSVSGSFTEWASNNDASVKRTVDLIMKILKYESQRNKLFVDVMKQFKSMVQKKGLSMLDIDNTLNSSWMFED